MTPFTFLDEADAQAACEWWQKELRLADWDIKCWIKRQENLSHADAQAEYRATPEHKEAWIKVLDPSHYPTDTSWPQDHEKSLVHELAHIHMNSFAPEDGTLARVAWEQASELIAHTLVRLRRLAYPEPPWRCKENGHASSGLS